MRRVPHVLAGLALAAAAALPAGATGCPLLTDVAGDGWLRPGTVSAPRLDIVSADLASGPATVVAVVRLASLTDWDAALAGQWFFVWHVAGNQHYVHLTRHALGSYVVRHEVAGVYVADPAFTVDAAAAEIRWTIDRASIPGLTTPGQVFGTFSASTSGPTGFADAAASSATYVDRSAGCVSAG